MTINDTPTITKVRIETNLSTSSSFLKFIV